MKVVEKKDRMGRVKVFFERPDQWVKDNADWMREHGYTARDAEAEAVAYTAPLPVLDVPEVIEVPETPTKVFGAWDGQALESGNDDETEYEPNVKRNRRKR